MIQVKQITFVLSIIGLFLGTGFLGAQIPIEQMQDPAMMDPAMRPDRREPREETITCPECGEESPVGTEYCPNCAYELEDVRPPDDPDVEEVEEVEEPKVTLIHGNVVICRVSGDVLEEPRRTEIPLTEAEGYEVLDEEEEIYGDITVIDDKYISPAVNIYRRRIVDQVDQAMQIDPLQFEGIIAASLEDRSALKNRYEIEINQMEILSEFRQKELEEFRVDPDDPYSEFHPVYFPEKPSMPPEEWLEQLEEAPAPDRPDRPARDPAMDPAAPPAAVAPEGMRR